MPLKHTLDIDIAGFRTMRDLMIQVQDKASEIRSLENNVLPKLKQQLAEWERKAKENCKPAEKERCVPPKRESVRDQLQQLQAEGR